MSKRYERAPAQHVCNTESPSRPCCWAARSRELAELAAMDAARIAKYGSLSCAACGKVYAVEGGIVEDHSAACEPLTDAQIWR